MYDNAGKKIKNLASGMAGVGISLCLVICMVMCATSKQLVVWGIIIAVVGSLISWLSMLFMAGFGELIQQATEINMLLKRQSVSVKGENQSQYKKAAASTHSEEAKAPSTPIPEGKYEWGQCEMCKRATRVAECKIGHMPYKYKLCAECITKCSAKIL